MEFHKILVPIDFSKPSRAALALAGGLARASGGRLTCLHVNELPPAFPEAEDSAEIAARLREDLTGRMKWAVDNVVGDDVEVECLLVDGGAEREILRQAVAGGHDLLVIGCKGRTDWERSLIGSVAERVLGGCAVPVLVTH